MRGESTVKKREFEVSEEKLENKGGKHDRIVFLTGECIRNVIVILSFSLERGLLD